MHRTRLALVGVIMAVLAGSTAVRAEVKAQEKSLVTFEGTLGKMVNFFGGKAAKEGIVTSVAVRGDRKMTTGDTTGQVIDLGEEKIYDLDLRNKTYTVTTFDELRRRMEEAQKKAEKENQREKGKETTADQNAPQTEVDFSIKETGQKRAINGYDTREVLMTIAVREKGKSIEQSGGMVMNASSWLAPKIPAYKELADFDRRYAEKLRGPATMGDAQAMASALAMYPFMRDAFQKFQAENVNLDGTPVLTALTVETVKSPEQVVQEKQREESKPAATGGFGGLGGMLARKMKKGEDKKDAGAESNRAKVMTMTHELLQLTPNATDADVAIPAGFREKK